MRKTLLLVVLLVGAVSAVPGKPEQWEEFKQKYGKVYKDPKEESHRRKVFAGNAARVAQHMAEYAAGQHTFTVALNQFADLTEEEIDRYKGLRMDANSTAPPPKNTETSTNQTRRLTRRQTAELPASLDWRDHGLVTGVKQQGKDCGSCWAIGTTGAVEGLWAKEGLGLAALSDQELIDCDKVFNQGCTGGWHFAAFAYIREHAIADNVSYPYTGKDGVCMGGGAPAAMISGFAAVEPRYDEEALRRALVTHGPIAVAADCSSWFFNFYQDGVFSSEVCNYWHTNHVMTLVGYGTQADYWHGPSTDYWLVKNSWGTDWGHGGYVKMRRNYNNKCGLATWAFFPLLGTLGEEAYDYYGFDGVRAKVGDPVWEQLKRGNYKAL